MLASSRKALATSMCCQCSTLGTWGGCSGLPGNTDNSTDCTAFCASIPDGAGTLYPGTCSTEGAAGVCQTCCVMSGTNCPGFTTTGCSPVNNDADTALCTSLIGSSLPGYTGCVVSGFGECSTANGCDLTGCCGTDTSANCDVLCQATTSQNSPCCASPFRPAECVLAGVGFTCAVTPGPASCSGNSCAPFPTNTPTKTPTITSTPASTFTPNPTPGGSNDCCACTGPGGMGPITCASPIGGQCSLNPSDNCSLEYNSACSGGLCISNTPTPSPAPTVSRRYRPYHGQIKEHENGTRQLRSQES